ncbi:EF-hand domain-containing protein [Polaromonas sp. P1(28)-8]|nr:EF-hand domain-containing protein [Polaromonas sp. P1(28)-8]
MTVKNHSIPNFGNFEFGSVVLIAALAMGAAAAARAQNSPPSPARPGSPPAQMAPSATTGTIPPNRVTRNDLEAAFNRADTNRDGKLDRQEAEHFPAVAQRFELIDTDHDTFISRGEFSSAAGS